MWNATRWYLPAILLGIYPVVTVIGANLGVVPLTPSIVARSLAFSAGVVVVILIGLRMVQRDLARRASWLAWLLLLLAFYSAVVLLAERLGYVNVYAGDPGFAATYGLVAAAIATAVSRPWKTHAREPKAFLLVAVGLVLVTLAPGLVAAARGRAAAWRPAADAVIAGSLSEAPRGAVAPERDIYYVVVDGLGRRDVVEEFYEVDLAPFADDLTARGFYVAERARANYAQTFLSLASALNMTYLDAIAAEVGVSAEGRQPLMYLIQQNALMRAASRAGYRVIAVGSDYMATERFARADMCLCSQHGLDDFELAALELTPLAALPAGWLREDSYDAHRRKVTDSFAGLEQSAALAGPKFVFAHLMVPHPPFVFAADGAPRHPRGGMFGDGDGFPGSRAEYVAGYRDQVQFVTARLAAVVDAVLRAPGPRPVIVIHADHGPGSRLVWNDPRRTSMRERFGIFAAFYFPDGPAGLYPAITPVNATRVLASRYLHANLAVLPDMSFFSTWNRPYNFLRVPADDPPRSD